MELLVVGVFITGLFIGLLSPRLGTNKLMEENCRLILENCELKCILAGFKSEKSGIIRK